ncbi:hypothetical protein J6590_101672 [Homalodisca vitripennis]|nr:hypothetical protein J6590_101672 [Homalodisca vitripennis]
MIRKFRDCEATVLANFLIHFVHQVITDERWPTTPVFIVNNVRSHDALPCTARSVLNGCAHRCENGGATPTTYRATPKRQLLYGRPSYLSFLQEDLDAIVYFLKLDKNGE